VSTAITKIKFSAEVVAVVTGQIQQWGTVETGGVLMGYIGNETLYVEKASGSGPKAIHDDIYFQADPNYIDMYIDMVYANSGGKLRYLGEWHTHPQITPEPSPKDIQSLDEIAQSAADFVLLVIIGAVDYSPTTFALQSISMITSAASDKIYVLEPDVRGGEN